MTLAAPGADAGTPLPVPNVNGVGSMYPPQPTYTQYQYPAPAAGGLMPQFPPPSITSVASYPIVPNAPNLHFQVSVVLPSTVEPSIPGTKQNHKPEKRRREIDSNVNVCHKKAKLKPAISSYIELPNAVSVAGN